MSIFKTIGRELTKEDAEKRSYFGILFRHFFDMCKLNLLFVACNLLFIAAVVWFTLPYILDFDAFLNTLLTKPVILPIWPFVPFLFMGPFIAGLTYVLRNWSRQEHAFVAYDFFDQLKENWKQGLLMSVLSTIFTYLFLNAIVFYLKMSLPPVFIIPIAGFVGITLLCMSFYTYPMMVTFDMKLKDILVNAWIFSMVKLPQNLFYLIILGLVHIPLFYYFPLLWAVLMVFVLIAWTGYTMNYYAWNVIDKYIIARMPQDEVTEEEETLL